MKRKFSNLWICILLIIAIFSINVTCTDKVYAINSMNGSGTEQDPYQITTLAQLDEVRNDLQAHYILMNDIDASDTANWNNGEGFVPIGDYGGDSYFKGCFDGQGYSIKNLYINDSHCYYAGLFGAIYGPGSFIKNLRLENVDITASNYTGGLVGLAEYFAIIESVEVTGNVKGDEYVGGVIGHTYNNSKGNNYKRLYSKANVDGIDRVGGIIGYLRYGGLEESYNTGAITGTSNVGAIVGYSRYESEVSDSYFDTSTSLATNGIGYKVCQGVGVVDKPKSIVK